MFLKNLLPKTFFAKEKMKFILCIMLIHYSSSIDYSLSDGLKVENLSSFYYFEIHILGLEPQSELHRISEGFS